MPRILLVDDMPMVRKTLSRLLRAGACEVVEASGPQEAAAELDTARFDVAVVDVWMPGGSGLDLMRRLKETHPELPVIIMSGGGPQAPLEYSLAVAEAEGAAAVLVKPFEGEQLLSAIRQVLGGGSAP